MCFGCIRRPYSQEAHAPNPPAASEWSSQSQEWVKAAIPLKVPLGESRPLEACGNDGANGAELTTAPGADARWDLRPKDE